ncbi:hypothetical protein HMPREF1210_00134 [Paenisporosarcina sp. HGH0030]|uniref:tyrosine-type recombinase/integrase n=1 Tax=Paenisporosarcina sp. HGH0030 TaxID=1078085 RepID=UPI00034E40E2|nr:tyrosine-type recombinase/integrase [Paenisporosarcina sp. HGH0030]EPD54149.1 hypothetical protein HMPREF1210_00134 [Paenisporosarcina sp. HGH0030]
MAPRKRKTQVVKQVSGLSFQRAREIVINIKAVEGKADNTIENYHKLFNDFDRFFMHRKLISNVTTEDARNFIKWQLEEKTQFLNARFRTNKKKGVTVTSANSYLRLAKAAFETLVRDGSLENNPFSPLTKIKQQTKQIEVLTIEQVKTIFKAFDKTWYADFRDYVVCNVMLDTFGRIDEICNLKKAHVDYLNGVVTFNETKNGRFRHVPISRKVVRMIEDLNLETEDFYSEYIFVSNHGTTLRPDAFRKHLKEVIGRTNIKTRVYPHLFRHTASTLFLANGGSVRALQKILGHAQIETTMIYSHMLDETIKTQHELFNPLKMINEKTTIKTKRKTYT